MKTQRLVTLLEWFNETYLELKKLDGVWFRNAIQYFNDGFHDKASEVYQSRRKTAKDFLKWCYEQMGMNVTPVEEKMYREFFYAGDNDTNYQM